MKLRSLWLWRSLLIVAFGVLLAPIAVLWCPGVSAWRVHLYRNLLYDQVVERVATAAPRSEEFLEELAEYVETHLWPAIDAAPYDGKPLDYLIEGIGWCDYMAKVYMRLLAVRGIPSRYAMLRRPDGVSPHTVAEVRVGSSWGVYDVLFGIRFVDDWHQPLSLERLAESPALLDTQPLMTLLQQQAPWMVDGIRTLYAQVLPIVRPPTRSQSATTRLTIFDHLLLCYAHWGGEPFGAWYQDRYLASAGLTPPTGLEQVLRVARHRHLAGRLELAKAGYVACFNGSERALASHAGFWLGLLQLELEGDAAGALHTFERLVRSDPNCRWVPLTWYYMGRCEEALGRTGEARLYYRKALEAGVVAAARRLADRPGGTMQTKDKAALSVG